MKLRSRLLLSCLLVPALVLGSAATASAKPRAGGGASFTYAVPGESAFPEGIAVSADQRRYFVSSARDGTIFRGQVDGHAARTFLPGGVDGRTSALGLKVDRGRLFVAGGATGSVWVYDLATRSLIRRFDTGSGGFINDLAITPNGDAYVTDSQRPYLYRIARADLFDGAGATKALAPFVTYPDLQAGLSANGIVAADARTLIYVNADRFYRVDLPSKAIETIDLRGASVSNGDGLVLRGRTLYVVRNQDGVIAKVRLARDSRSGRPVGETRDPPSASRQPPPKRADGSSWSTRSSTCSAPRRRPSSRSRSPRSDGLRSAGTALLRSRTTVPLGRPPNAALTARRASSHSAGGADSSCDCRTW